MPRVRFKATAITTVTLTFSQGSRSTVMVTQFHCNGVMVITTFSCNGDSNGGCNACNGVIKEDKDGN